MVDLAVLASRLEDLTGERYAITSIRRASTGFANATWLVEAEPRSVAIKVQTAPAYVYDCDPGFEPAVLDALAPTPVPVPHLLGRDPDGSCFGSPWFAMAFVDGVGLPDDQLAGYAQDGWFVDADPARRTEIWNRFIDLLADLHGLPAATFGTDPRGGTHARMLEYWTSSLHDTMRLTDAPVQVRALDWLTRNAPGSADANPRPCMGDARMANLLVFPIDSLRAAVRELMRGFGSQPKEVELVTENLLQANLTGHDSHGIGMLPRYADAFREGWLQPNAHAEIRRDSGATLSLDGRAGFGQVIGHEAMEIGITRAKQHGCCILALGNAHHLGRIGAWAEMAVAEGLISVHFVNVISRPIVAPGS